MDKITKLTLLLSQVSDLSNALMKIEDEITDLIDEIIDEESEDFDDEDEEIDEDIKIGLDSQD